MFVLQIVEEDDLFPRETDRIFERPVDGRLGLVKAEQMRGVVHVERRDGRIFEERPQWEWLVFERQAVRMPAA